LLCSPLTAELEKDESQVSTVVLVVAPVETTVEGVTLEVTVWVVVVVDIETEVVVAVRMFAYPVRYPAPAPNRVTATNRIASAWFFTSLQHRLRWIYAYPGRRRESPRTL